MEASMDDFIRDNFYGTIILKKSVVDTLLNKHSLVVNQIIYYGIHVVSWNSEEGKFNSTKITTSTTESEAIDILLSIYVNMSHLTAGELYAHADVVRCTRKCYDHFAIYDNVRKCFYEYQKPFGATLVKICETSAYEFMLREHIVPKVVKYQAALPAIEVIQRARSRIGVQGYHVLYRNCQHFATWCKLGSPDSTGVSSLVARVHGSSLVIQVSGFGLMIAKALFSASAFSVPLGLLVVGAGAIGGFSYLIKSKTKDAQFDDHELSMIDHSQSGEIL
jgi:hypothetical protein